MPAASVGSNAPPSPDPLTTPPVGGLHLQFGADAAPQIVVSWHTLQPVKNPRVMLGSLDGQLNQVTEAKEVSYTDAKSGQAVYAYHAKVGGLKADTAYLYGAVHNGADAEFATFRTAPRGRAKFTFTSFGDQAPPTVGRKYKPPEGVTLPNPPFVIERQSAFSLLPPPPAEAGASFQRLEQLKHGSRPSPG